MSERKIHGEVIAKIPAYAGLTRWSTRPVPDKPCSIRLRIALGSCAHVESACRCGWGAHLGEPIGGREKNERATAARRGSSAAIVPDGTKPPVRQETTQPMLRRGTGAVAPIRALPRRRGRRHGVILQEAKG